MPYRYDELRESFYFPETDLIYFLFEKKCKAKKVHRPQNPYKNHQMVYAKLDGKE